MNFISRVFKNYSIEDPSQPLFRDGVIGGGSTSDAGITMTHKAASSLSACGSCQRIISEDLAALPLAPYYNDNGDIVEATDHRLYPILHDSPNEYMSSVTLRYVLNISMLRFGAAYAYIERDGAARVIALHPLAGDKTAPVFKDGVLWFGTTQTPTGATAFIEPANVLHIPYATYDGLTAVSPIMQYKNTLGLGLAAEKYGSKFFANGARHTGVYALDGTLSDEAHQRLVQSIADRATGDNALRPLVLEGGLSWAQQSVPNNEAQFLETRVFQVQEVARIYRVPMHLLQSLERATNNNIEHQSLDYIRYCLKPNAVRIEQEMMRKLVPGKGRKIIIEHDFNDFSRGDVASQAIAATGYRNAGALSVDDIRRKFLRMNPIGPKSGGDIYLAPINYQPLSQLTPENFVPPTPQQVQQAAASEKNDKA